MGMPGPICEGYRTVKRATIEQFGMLVMLVAVGAAMRLYFREIPNFAPVAGLALFAGFFFRNRWMAAAAPLGVMLVTDLVLGGYQPLLMASVYGMLALPVCLRGWVRAGVERAAQERSGLSYGALVAGLLASCLACSLAFFLVTNFTTWAVTAWYPRTAAGLWSCYVNALPFLRYTLAGDLFATTLFSGAYAAWVAGRERAAATAAVSA
jgi:hypothetical protein